MSSRIQSVLLLSSLLIAAACSAPAPPPDAQDGGAAPAPARATGLIGSREGHAAQGELLAALFRWTGEVLAVGIAAQDPDDPPCRQGYAGLVAMSAELERRGVGGAPLPPRSEYLARCAALPAELKACLPLRRILAGDPACEAALERASPAARESFLILAGRALFKGEVR